MNVAGCSFLVYWLYQNKKKVCLLVWGTEFVLTLSKSLFGRNVNKYMWFLQYVIHVLLRYHTASQKRQMRKHHNTKPLKIFHVQNTAACENFIFSTKLSPSQSCTVINFQSFTICMFSNVFFSLIILFKRMIQNKNFGSKLKAYRTIVYSVRWLRL